MGQIRSISPVLRYRNPEVAAQWLCAAFGFDPCQIQRESNGEISYITLTLGSGSVLICPIGDTAFDDFLVQPGQVGGANTQTCYLKIEDTEEHCRAAAAAGAKIELDPQSDGADKSFYTCRDIEGYLWTFGTNSYDAPAERNIVVDGATLRAPVSIASGGRPKSKDARLGERPKRRAPAVTLVAGSLIALIGLGATALLAFKNLQPSVESGTAMVATTTKMADYPASSAMASSL